MVQSTKRPPNSGLDLHSLVASKSAITKSGRPLNENLLQQKKNVPRRDHLKEFWSYYDVDVRS